MLFIDHDQRQLRHAGKNGHARSEHDAGAARVRGQPAFEALRVGHAAVHADHGLPAIPGHEAGDEALFQLRREIDLGHHHQSLCLGAGIQHGLDGAQINLCLAAAGAAIEQEGAGVLRNLLENRGLLGAERYQRHCAAGVRRMSHRLGARQCCFGGLCLPALAGWRLGCLGRSQPPGQLLGRHLAQLWWQGGDGDFTEAALVIVGGKGHQPSPGLVQWRYALQLGGNAAQLHPIGNRFRGGRRIPDHAQQLPFSQGNAYQRAGLQRRVATVAQQITYGAMGRGLDGNVNSMGHGLG